MIESTRACGLYGGAGVGKTELALKTVADLRADNRLPPVRYTSLAEPSAVDAIRERTRRASSLGEDACTLVLDDVDGAVVPAVRELVAEYGGPASRVLVVSRERVLLDAPALELGSLRPADALELAARLDRCHGSLYERIAERSGGNPHLLRTLLSSVSRLELPPEAHQLLVAQLGDIDSDERALLELLLAAHQPLGVDVLTALAPETEQALRRLADRQLVTIRDGLLQLVGAVAEELRRGSGAPSPATRSTLDRIARRWLQKAPDAAEALSLSASTRLREGDAAGAFEVLQRHDVARAALPLDDATALLTTIIASDDGAAVGARRLLAGLRLRAGEVHAALTALQPSGGGRDEQRRLHLMRAAALLRAADAAAVRLELDRAAAVSDDGDDDVAIVLAREELALLAGDVDGARDRLIEGAARIDAIPRHAARRAALLAFSHVLDERYEEALVGCEQARALVARERIPWMLPCIEIRALVALGHVARAVEMLARVDRAASDGLYDVCRAMIMLQRGEFADVLAELEGTLEQMERRGDSIGRTLLALCLARASFGAGDAQQAQKYARCAERVTSQASFAALAPLGHMAAMLLSAMRCEWGNACARVREARALCPTSPFVGVDSWWASAQPWSDISPSMVDAARAYFDLRASERALAEGRVELAERHAAAAERWYDRVGNRFDYALALLARSEAAARRGDATRALELLGRLHAVAERQQYAVVRTAAALVRASVADRAGDIDAYVAALDRARRAAGEGLRSDAVAAACSRAGLDVLPGAAVDGQPFRDRIRRLGLARPATRLCSVGEAVYLLDDTEPLPIAGALVLDLAAAVARTDAGSHELHRQALSLLALLAEASGDGVDIEELYLRVWGGSEFHPLRHRNAVYVAVNRLRAAMQALVGREVVSKRGDGRYSVDQAIRIIVVRPVPPEARPWRPREASDELPRDPHAYARRLAVPVAQARWEQAVSRTATAWLSLLPPARRVERQTM